VLSNKVTTARVDVIIIVIVLVVVTMNS
jgi:hypothetical protein